MILRDVKGERYRELPERGMDKASLAKYMQEAASKETKWQKATISGTVYHSGQEIREVICDAFKTFIYANPLHPDCFPAVRKMEAEVVQMCVDIFKGGKNACGTMTSGGTESIIMAIKAYRDWAREVKGIMDPEIIKPTTAHAAFDKGCHYLGVRLVEVPVDPVTCRVKVSAVAKALNRNTIMVVGSAISYPHGVMDDILSLAELTKKHGCGLHVDNCLGSLLLPFLPSAGYKLPPFDFSVEGVTSLSCDTHKYGFAPKGSSVILYANQELRHHQYFVAPDWPGGIYATPSMGGSRPGALIACSWAAMMHLGKEGYRKTAAEIMKASKTIENGILDIDGLKLLGKPDMSVVCFQSSDPKLNIFNVGDAMSSRGWSLSVLQFPAAIHICVTHVHTKDEAATRFLADLKASVNHVRTAKEGEFKDGMGAIYGMAESIPDRSMVNALCSDYIDALYTA
mmetsp:Transcript_31974/g.49938  ORF Transcript_31974/g.49938 Transcript_31974/m.49938 type:complete len:455 (-) Transcript_31974:193-1557(-)